MKHTVGLVCEGPRDVDLIEKLIDSFLPEDEIDYRLYQPEQSLLSANYNGWKGVIRWCRRDYNNIVKNNSALHQPIDLLVIHMDGDVSRDEQNKQVHCTCGDYDCPARVKCTVNGQVRMEDCCEIACSLPFPCENHEGTIPEKYVTHLNNLLDNTLGETKTIPIVITVPCDSTDSWIVAAYETEDMSYEEIVNPWDSIIARKKDYHGIRIPGRKKTGHVYEQLNKIVVQNWDIVKEKCPQADRFQKDIQNALHQVAIS